MLPGEGCNILLINMDSRTQEKLLAINQIFYDNFADSFTTTRHQVQPGVRELINEMVHAKAILDVGCGNGTLARALAERLGGEGMSCFRVRFPKGMDANDYAVRVTPAEKSLGVLLRLFERLG